MNTSIKLNVSALMIALLLMGGCSKSDDPANSNQSSADAPSMQDALSAEGQKAAAIAALPQANPDTPLEQYAKLTSGNQLMFMYYGLSNMPVDYETIATLYSRDYNATSDAFKRQDIIKALTPRIDAEIAKAKEFRYFQTEDDANLSSFDFNSKGFTVNNQIGADSFSYFYDNRNFQYSFTNGEKFKHLKVEDEAKARQIESMVNKSPRMKLVIYAYVQDADPSSRRIKCEIVKVKLTDGRGNELLIQ